jgi:hypothetical protein
VPRKPKNDTPKGGWEPPLHRDPRPALRYTAGSKNGKWIWKPIDAAYLKWCEEQRQIANGAIKPASKIRVRTRKRS